MDAVRHIQKKYCSHAMIVAIIIGSLLIIADLRPIGKGLLLGTLFSILNFVLMGQAIPHQLGKAKRATFWVSLSSLSFRYTLLALPIIAALKFEQINLFAVVAGIFLVQLMILVDQLKQMIVSRSSEQV